MKIDYSSDETTGESEAKFQLEPDDIFVISVVVGLVIAYLVW
jgi:hypothetical protein